MTWPAALPVTALRVLRTAAGWRALQVALLVGGLFALGFLCGERAYAADGVSVGTGTSTSSVSAPSASSGAAPSASSGVAPSVPKGDGIGAATRGAVERLVGEPARKGAQASAEPRPPQAPANRANPATPQPAAPSAPAPHPADNMGSSDGTSDTGDTDRQPLRPVSDHLIQDVVESVTEELAEVPPLASLPSLPVLPESPSWPGLPGFEVPSMPSFPGLPGLPALPAVPGQTLPAPVTTTPQPGSEAPASGDGRGKEGRTGTAAPAPVIYGPWSVAGAAAPDTSAPGDARRIAPSGYAPVQQAPADHPGGLGGSRSAGDNSSPRHGDAHAVSLSQRAPLRLVPGAAARADVDEIQDRHGDIPVSPA
ncbi:hypothetical protein SAMN04487981_103280 [Streptomyces sp. cf386]|uniref:hypothetical protein n=1 Tax=Streptomyces sp. cf386 TaxID=1761904 RepID=UPI00088DD81E|nr:hypothetical protein [Streptomyces sp. cf386]SDN02028.1 hypothetical protein SAMN04487981_103280 [Streptomyces sp. cf386]